jgi:hypothetical protein
LVPKTSLHAPFGDTLTHKARVLLLRRPRPGAELPEHPIGLQPGRDYS